MSGIGSVLNQGWDQGWVRALRRAASDDRRAHRDRRHIRRGGRRAKDRPRLYPTLLVADSHRDSRVASVKWLKDWGFRVLEAATADQALDVIRRSPPHMILIELLLPQIPAWRLPSRLAQSPQTRDIPLIVLNPAVMTAADFEGKTSGPILFRPAGMLVKPVPPAVMREEVRRALRAHAAR